MNTNFEVRVVCTLKIVPALNFRKVTPTFDTSLDQTIQVRYKLYIYLNLHLFRRSQSWKMLMLNPSDKHYLHLPQKPSNWYNFVLWDTMNRLKHLQENFFIQKHFFKLCKLLTIKYVNYDLHFVLLKMNHNHQKHVCVSLHHISIISFPDTEKFYRLLLSKYLQKM